MPRSEGANVGLATARAPDPGPPQGLTLAPAKWARATLVQPASILATTIRAEESDDKHDTPGHRRLHVDVDAVASTSSNRLPASDIHMASTDLIDGGRSRR
jgi:hypothetical protein